MHWKNQTAPQLKQEAKVDRLSRLTLVPLTIASLFGLLLVVSIIKQPSSREPQDTLATQRPSTATSGDATKTSGDHQPTDLFVAVPPRLSPPPHDTTAHSLNHRSDDRSAGSNAGVATSTPERFAAPSSRDASSTPQAPAGRDSMDLTDLVKQNLSPSESIVTPTDVTSSNAQPPAVAQVPHNQASSVQADDRGSFALQLEPPRSSINPDPNALSMQDNGASSSPLDSTNRPQDGTLRLPPTSTPALPQLQMPERSTNFAPPQIPTHTISTTESSVVDPLANNLQRKSETAPDHQVAPPYVSGNNHDAFIDSDPLVADATTRFNTSARTGEPSLPPQVVRPIAEQVKHGGQLASKGALFSARDELQHALYLIANARATLLQSNEPTEQLDAAMTAMREADDFSRRQEDPNFQLDLAAISTSHRTPVLKQMDARSLSAIESSRRYYEFAGQNLIDSLGHEPVAAEALYSLGKLHIMQHGLGEHGVTMPVPKAVIYFQSAVMIDARHHRAANELGVQLARLGEFAGAKEALLMSVAIEPSVTSWRNLAHVHRQLGEGQLAQLAENEAVIFERQAATAPADGTIQSPSGPIQFVPPAQFGEGESGLPTMSPNGPIGPTSPNAPAIGNDRTQANHSRFLGIF